MMQDEKEYHFGPSINAEGVTFRLWAPSAESVSLLLVDERPRLMHPSGNGFFELFVPSAGAGQRYKFEVAGQPVPDPASRLQDLDVFDWSVVCAPLQRPSKFNQPRRPWHEAIIVEVHLGTATPEGTYAGLTRRLQHYADAGFSAIELMPIADFSGQRNWGYDGVLPFAPDRSYGSREELLELIDTAHQLGLSIILDVVYNHFGPSGNFLHLYAESFFSTDEATPWGAAIDLKNPIVRRFFTENTRMWIEEFQFDGLRFDAVHAFSVEGGALLLSEIAAMARAIAPDVYLILENDNNEVHWLQRDGTHPQLFSAQWNDDYHHVFHVLATRESDGYYQDYQNDTISAAARILTEGFFYQGEPSPHRDDRPRGERSQGTHPVCFVSFLQNHDQIGNRARGDRLRSLASPACVDLLSFTMLLSPQIPMLFMGEEFGAKTPFNYFCDFHGELADAIREGRRQEFKAFENFIKGDSVEILDPNDVAAFQSSRLDWDMAGSMDGQAHLKRFRGLVDLRRRVVTPLLGGHMLGTEVIRQETALFCQWTFSGGGIALAINLSDSPTVIEIATKPVPTATEGQATILPDRIEFGPWSGAFWRLN